MMMIGGMALAAAVVAAQGWGMGPAIPVEAIAVAAAIGSYVWGRSDSDLGAMLSEQADERQELLRAQAQAFAALAVAVAAIVGCVIAVLLVEQRQLGAGCQPDDDPDGGWHPARQVLDPPLQREIEVSEQLPRQLGAIVRA